MPRSASEILFNGAVGFVVDLLRMAVGQRAAVRTMLEALENKLAADVQEVVGKSERTISRLGALVRQTKGTIATAYGKIAGQQQAAMARVAKIAAKQQVQDSNAIVVVPLNTVGHTPEQLAAIASKAVVAGKHPGEWWDAQGKALRDKFATQMRLGMLQGEGVDKLIQRVRGTKAKNFTDGLMQASKAQAEALVRTSVITVANEARIATIVGNPAINKGIQWVATLDARTTEICRALDGLVWSVPGLEPQGHDKAFPGATAHWQCRSTQIPVTKSWAELASKPIKTAGLQGKYEELLRAKLARQGMKPAAIEQFVAAQAGRFDGKGVPGTKTTADWLDGLDAAEVDRALGPGRGKLYRDGKITLQDLTDQSNRPLTLAELERKVAADVIPVPAFKSLADAEAYFGQHFGVTALESSSFSPDIWGKPFASERPMLDHAEMIAGALRDLKIRFPKIPIKTKGVYLTEVDRPRGHHDGPGPYFSAESKEWDKPARDAVAAWEKANGRRWGAYRMGEPTRPQAVHHELGHNLSVPAIEALAQKVWDARGPLWVKQNVSEYAGANVMEFMAESFGTYVHPSYVRGTFPAEMEEFLQMMTGEK